MENRYNSFTNYILSIYHAIFIIKSNEMAQYDLRGADVSCLFYLGFNGDNITASELSALSGEDKGAISRALTHLNNEGFLTYADNKKYRARILLTEKGKNLSIYIIKRVNEIFFEAGKGLTEEERNELYRLLNIISENLNKICLKYGGKNEN